MFSGKHTIFSLIPACNKEVVLKSRQGFHSGIADLGCAHLLPPRGKLRTVLEQLDSFKIHRRFHARLLLHLYGN